MNFAEMANMDCNAAGDSPAKVNSLASWVEGICCWLDAIGDGGTRGGESPAEGARLRAICTTLSHLAMVRTARVVFRHNRPNEVNRP